jgi:hypothetical protein
MDDILARLVGKAPIAVMVRATLARAVSPPALNDLFRRCAQRQYTKQLTFAALVQLMTKVTFRTHDSVHAAYRHTDDVSVSITAVYDKLNRLEPGVTAALVRDTAQALAAVIAALPGPAAPAPVAGFRVRTLDGNFLAGTDHRLGCLRGSGAAALPGMALVVRDQTGLLTDLIPCEDAYTSERSLAGPVVALARPGDLWLADRNFCTLDYLGGLAERRACFLIRHHAGTALTPAGAERFAGATATGDVSEQAVRAGGLALRCVTVRLRAPLRDGTTAVRLLTNVPAHRAGARRLAELYRTRWSIEAAFQELTESLRCEVTTLGYPKAALFAFALAAVAYNLLVVVQAALRSGRGPGPVDEELSYYHLATEVRTHAEALPLVPDATWEQFARMAVPEFAAWLHASAQTLNWHRYRKNPRGPKKPATIIRTCRGAHRSTARLLKRP